MKAVQNKFLILFCPNKNQTFSCQQASWILIQAVYKCMIFVSFLSPFLAVFVSIFLEIIELSDMLKSDKRRQQACFRLDHDSYQSYQDLLPRFQAQLSDQSIFGSRCSALKAYNRVGANKAINGNMLSTRHNYYHTCYLICLNSQLLYSIIILCKRTKGFCTQSESFS